MDIVKFARSSVLMFSTLVLIAACGGGGGGGGTGSTGSTDDGSSGDTPDNTAAEITLTALDRRGLSGGQSGLNQLARFLGAGELARVNAKILSVSLADGSESETTFQIDIDPSSFSIPGTIPISNLPPGQYDFYFLMTVPENNKQYAGITPNWTIVEVNAGSGERNVVDFLVHPVLGDPIPNFDTLRALAEFQFGFSDLPIDEWADPSFGIKVDSGDENIYSINSATGFSQAFVYLPEGQYTFEVRFYDGEELVVVPIIITVDISKEGGSIDVDVVPIDIVNNVTPEEGGSIMNLVINAKAIEQAGGLGNVSAVFALQDDESLLYERVLTLASDGSGNYEATVDVTGLQPGFMTWTVQLYDQTKVYGWCAQTIELAAGEQTLICTLRLAEEMPAFLRVVATTIQGDPVSGAIVIANGEPIGITGSGSNGTEAGVLEVFLPAGEYRIAALHPLLGQPAEQKVTLTNGETISAQFEFIPDDQTPPTVTIGSPANGSVTNNPTPALLYSIDEESVTVHVYLDLPGGGKIEVLTRSGENLSSLKDGSYVLTVQARDQAGNVGIAEAGFTVDSLAPGISIVSPVNESVLKRSPGEMVLLSGETGVASVYIDDGNEILVDVTAGTQVREVMPELGDGPHHIEAFQTDAAGNQSSAITEFTVDSTPPVVEILSPLGETEEHEPLLQYQTDENGTEAVLVDGQTVETRNDQYLPWISDGPHEVTVEVTDLAGNKGSDTSEVVVVSPPPIKAFELDAYYYKRPRERVDDKVWVEGAVTVRIPDQEAIQVIAGNADRYLVYLRLGEVHCLYLGGKGNAHFGALEWQDVEWFRKFNSPVCGLGRYRAGDEVTVSGSIYMRILFGDPKFEETHIKLFLDIIGDGKVTDGDGEPRHRQHWRWWRDRSQEENLSDDDWKSKWWWEKGRWHSGEARGQNSNDD